MSDKNDTSTMFYSGMDNELDNERSNGRMIFILGLIVSALSLYFDVKDIIEQKLVLEMYPRLCTSLFSLVICMIAVIIEYKLGG